LKKERKNKQTNNKRTTEIIQYEVNFWEGDTHRHLTRDLVLVWHGRKCCATFDTDIFVMIEKQKGHHVVVLLFCQ
jgi:hypothetical protein